MNEVIHLNWYSGHMDLIIPNFFPTTITKIRKLDKLQSRSDVSVDSLEIDDFWGHVLYVLQDTTEECQLSLYLAEHDYKMYKKQDARRKMQQLQTRVKGLRKNIAFIKEEYCNGRN